MRRIALLFAFLLGCKPDGLIHDLHIHYADGSVVWHHCTHWTIWTHEAYGGALTHYRYTYHTQRCDLWRTDTLPAGDPRDTARSPE